MEFAIDIVYLRAKIPNDIFTTLELNLLLEGYRNKGAKVASLLRHRHIIPLRRGLYTFAESLRRGALSTENPLSPLATVIPETPAVVTSVSMGRSRSFANEFGVFTYRYCRSKAYSVGVTLSGDERHRFFIALPFKALYDKALNDRRWDGGDPEAYLTEDLRIDMELLQTQDKQVLHDLAPFMEGRLKKLRLFLEKL